MAYGQPPNMWDRLQSGVGGMFSNLGERTSPYSNRLTMAGLGMLSGGNANEGWKGAMQGLVAGSAMDTEKKRERIMQDLMKDPNSVFSDLGEGDRAAIGSDPELFRAAMAARLQPADSPGSWDEYVRTTHTPTEEGYDAFLQRKGASSGVSISLSQVPADTGAKIGLADMFITELNVGSGGHESLRERIKATFGGDHYIAARRDLALGRGEATAIWRRAETGSEALTRILTGAGMMTAEKQEAIVKNSLRPTDDVKTMLDKMDWLETQLAAIKGGVVESRTGEMVRDAGDGGGGSEGTLTRDADGTLIWSP